MPIMHPPSSILPSFSQNTYITITYFFTITISFRKYKRKVVIYLSEADLELVKLVVMTNVFFNNHQREIEIKVWFLHQQLKSTFSWYMQNVKTDLYRKLRFQPNLLVQRRKQMVGGKEIFQNLIYSLYYDQLLALPPPTTF